MEPPPLYPRWFFCVLDCSSKPQNNTSKSQNYITKCEYRSGNNEKNKPVSGRALQAASTLGVCFSALFTFCICQVGPSIRRPEPSGKLEHTTRQKNPQNFWHARGTPTTAPIFPKILGLIMAGQFGQNVNKAEKPSPLYTCWFQECRKVEQKFLST